MTIAEFEKLPLGNKVLFSDRYVFIIAVREHDRAEFYYECTLPIDGNYRPQPKRLTINGLRNSYHIANAKPITDAEILLSCL